MTEAQPAKQSPSFFDWIASTILCESLVEPDLALAALAKDAHGDGEGADSAERRQRTSHDTVGDESPGDDALADEDPIVVHELRNSLSPARIGMGGPREIGVHGEPMTGRQFSERIHGMPKFDEQLIHRVLRREDHRPNART